MILHLLSQSASNSEMSTKGIAWFHCYVWQINEKREGHYYSLSNLLSHDFKAINLTQDWNVKRPKKLFEWYIYLCVCLLSYLKTGSVYTTMAVFCVKHAGKIKLRVVTLSSSPFMSLKVTTYTEHVSVWPSTIKMVKVTMKLSQYISKTFSAKLQHITWI